MAHCRAKSIPTTVKSELNISCPILGSKGKLGFWGPLCNKILAHLGWVWVEKKHKLNKDNLLFQFVLSNWSIGLTANAGSTRDSWWGMSGKFCIKKTHSNKWNQPYSMNSWHHLESSSQLGIALPSAVPPKRFSSGGCYWSHLSDRIPHHLWVSWKLFVISQLYKNLVNILWREL